MRTPPISQRLARQALPLVVFCAAGALAAARPALAQGFLTFDHLAVEDCAESGPCEWKLSCKVAGGKDEELVPNGAGAEGSEIEIGKSRSIARFPVEVSCSAWEDDGWLGTSWKEVTTGSVSVPAGGDYSIALANSGQGTVRVVLRADSLEMGTPPPAGSPRRFAGVFRDGKAGHAVLVGMPWRTLDARRVALAKQGVQPVELSSYAEGKNRLWNGVFRTSSLEHEVVSGLEWEPFQARVKALADRGLKVVDFETYPEGKKRLFTAVFRRGPEENALRVGLTPLEFQNFWAKVAGQGLRLVDLEVYRSGRDRLYAGAFLSGSGSYGFRTQLDRDALLGRMQEASGRLLDVETYEEGKNRMYDAVFLGGTGKATLETDLDWAAFAARWRENAGKGLRLVDLETYPE
jgi:polyglycine hydrolase-like protein